MPNYEYRTGSDGKGYPRLRVRKLKYADLPWLVEVVYAPGQFGKKELRYEGIDSESAYRQAGRLLDEALAKPPRPRPPVLFPFAQVSPMEGHRDTAYP